MIEKIFIVFVIMEACGLILHISDSIRCWTDRIYYRKQQNNVNDFNQRMYESKKREEESIKTYTSHVQYLCGFLDEMKIRVQKLEEKLEEKTGINKEKKHAIKKTKETK